MNKNNILNNVDDIETDFSLIGNNPGNLACAKASIVYLPGFGCDFYEHSNFKDLLVSYDYYAINLPAHGLSNWSNAEDLTLKGFADIVVSFIEKRQLEKVILIGHFSSAAVAAIVNGLIPDTIIGNIFISPIDSSFQKDADEVRDILVPRIPEALDQLQRLKVFNWDIKSLNNIQWKEFSKLKLAHFNKNAEPLNIILDYLLDPQLKLSIENVYANITIPTLLLFGDSDGLLRTKQVIDNVSKLIKGSKVAIIPMAGHEPALDNPMNYYNNVITFIDSVVENYNNENETYKKEVNL